MIYMPLLFQNEFSFLKFLLPPRIQLTQIDHRHTPKKKDIWGLSHCVSYGLFGETTTIASLRVEHSMLDLKRVFLHSLHD